jgi:hypothetical protein
MTGRIRHRLARRWGIRCAAIAATAIAAAGALAMPAAADVVAENSGVRGRANWTWASKVELSNLTMGVRDLKCDSNDVYVQLRVFYTNGEHRDTQRRYNSNGCGTAVNWSGLSYTANFYIRGVQVIACVDDSGSNTCAYSAVHDNPRT